MVTGFAPQVKDLSERGERRLLVGREASGAAFLSPAAKRRVMPSTPETRRRAVVEAVLGARKADEAVTFVADGPRARVTYQDRRLRVDVDETERERLETLLSEYPVFKIQQPDTRKADEGVVYLSAVTDPKHAADFVEALFREVYGAGREYELRVERRG